MDDNKLSHKTPAVISDIIKNMKKHFGDLYVGRGNTHTFLGMKFEIRDRIIQDDMVKQLDKCIAIFREDVRTSVSSPVTNKLFEVMEDADQLSVKKG